jgi:transposase
MPSGNHLSNDIRNVICYAVQHNRSGFYIFQNIFNSDPTKISLEYLNKLVCQIRNQQGFAEAYISGPQPIPGRRKMLNLEEIDVLIDLLELNKRTTIRILTDNFRHYYYPNELPAIPIAHEQPPSMSTVSRVLMTAAISRKVVEHRHILRDDDAGLDYLYRIAHINPWNFVDVDETSNDAKSFMEKYGYELIGRPCIVHQINLGGKTYCTIAAVTPNGFLCWQIFDTTVDAEMFCRFLRDELAVYLSPENNLIIDNASIHHTADVRIELETVTGGNYYFVPPYSPHLKPIETCFSLIKRDVMRDNRSELEPVAAINRAFTKYRVGGLSAHEIRPHWNIYFHLHGFLNRDA